MSHAHAVRGATGAPLWCRDSLGGRIWCEFPGRTQINISVIAAGLSRLCRFGGHLRDDLYYSVASHSVMVSRLVPPEHARAALLHDATEAYMGCDIPHPWKKLAPELRAHEHAWAQAIELWAGLPFGALSAPEIKRADRQALAVERRDLTALPYADAEGWDPRGDLEPPPGWECMHEEPRGARLRFLARARELGLTC